LAFSAVAVVAGSGEAVASGFALREQSGSLLGQAFAGENAYAADPSIIFFNPRRHVRARRHAGKRRRQLHFPEHRIQ
jgi:long-subunit fatty acid transport protein